EIVVIVSRSGLFYGGRFWLCGCGFGGRLRGLGCYLRFGRCCYRRFCDCWCCVAINKVLSRFEYLQAGAAPHHAAGSTQMLVADAKAGLTMGAAGNVYGHEQSLAFNPCKNNPVILL